MTSYASQSIGTFAPIGASSQVAVTQASQAFALPSTATASNPCIALVGFQSAMQHLFVKFGTSGAVTVTMADGMKVAPGSSGAPTILAVPAGATHIAMLCEGAPGDVTITGVDALITAFAPDGASVEVSVTSTSQAVAVPAGDTVALVGLQSTQIAWFVKFGSGAVTVSRTDGLKVKPGTAFNPLVLSVPTGATHFAILCEGADGPVRVTGGTLAGGGGSSSGSEVPRFDSGVTPNQDLKIVYVSAATVTVTATILTLFDSGGNPKRFGPVNVTPNMAVSGAGGLDTGAEAASTWYHIWGIGKADGTTSVVFSASATAPTLPVGYTYYGYLGAIYNNSSSNFIAMAQVGNLVTQLSQQVVGPGTQTSFTAVSLAAFVPPTAKSVWLRPGIWSSSGANAVQVRVASDGSGATATYGVFPIGGIIIPNPEFLWGVALVPLITAQQFKYLVSGTNAEGFINVEGWEYL